MLKRFNSYQTLANALLREATQGEVTTISFDVFDTLVHRRLAPEIVIESVCSTFLDLLREHRLPLPQQSLLRHRHDAYQTLAHRHVTAGLDPDTTLDELAPAWVSAVTGLESEHPLVGTIAERLIETEVATERRVCFANPWLGKILPVLRQRGIAVYGISDMYLGARHVSTILSDGALLNWLDALYVSGDHRALKRSGKLYALVRDSLNLDPARWLHVGDNLESDGLMASRRGIRAWIINDRTVHLEARRQAFDATMPASFPERAGAIITGYSHALDEPAIAAERMFGRRIIGPILTTFIHRVLERCREEGIGHVYFVAREGHLLKQIYRHLAPQVFPGGNAPPATYLAVSRLSTLHGAMRRYGVRELDAAMANCGHHSVRNLLLPLQLGGSDLARLAAKHGITDIDAALLPPAHRHPSLLRLLDDPEVVCHAEALGNSARQLLHEYLRQAGWFDQERVAVVDLGWGGQIQDNLRQSLAQLPQRPEILGLYLGTNAQAAQRRHPDSRLEGLLADVCLPEWSADAAFEFVFVLEAVCRAPHGTTLGYRMTDDGRVIPVFRSDDDPPRLAEKADERFIALIQAGILDQAALYADCAHILRLRGEDMLPQARALIERMIRYPTTQEILWWSRLSNVADLGSSHTETLGPDGVRTNWRLLRHHLRDSRFHYGSAGLVAGRTGQLTLGILKALRRAAAPVPTPFPLPTPTPLRRIPHGHLTTPDWERQIDAEFARLAEGNGGEQCSDTKERIGRLGATELTMIAIGHVLASMLAFALGRRIPPRSGPIWWVALRREVHARLNTADRIAFMRRVLGRRVRALWQ